MFSTRDEDLHKRLKRPVASKYSMTSLRNLEYLVDPCSTIFTDAMTDLQGQVVDLGAWMHWYAFDVAGAITFSRDFGFMKERRDAHDVIAGLRTGMVYMSIVGQMPWLHWWLLGSMPVRKLLGWATGGKGDPLPVMNKVCGLP
jgi:hypothetical protein